MKEIYTSCSPCGGTGNETISSLVDGETVHTEITCRVCGGTGLRSNLSLSGDLIDFLNDLKVEVGDIKDKVNDIFEKVN